jgi:Ca2+-binding RTX toxin-like protein
MTSISFGKSIGIDMGISSFPVPSNAYKGTFSSTVFALYYSPSEYDKFTGSGFTYNSSGYPVGGKISSWSYFYGGASYFTITSLNMQVSTYMSFYYTNNWSGLLQTALGGNDTITGTSGLDKLYGYGGNDTVMAGNASDNVWGGDGDDALAGEAGDDNLYGESGNDKLTGGAGTDHLTGGDGNDTYSADEFDQIAESATNGGIDTVEMTATQAGLTFTIGGSNYANVEKFKLMGALAGNVIGDGAHNQIVGNAAANMLEGEAGNDWLQGGAGNDTLEGDGGNDTLDGGAGADIMRGGADDDTYYVDNAADQIQGEESAGGNDQVLASVAYILADGVERLTLLGTTGIGATGNGSSNTLTGNSGANLLDGLGGADTLIGGKGGDTYVIDDVNDVVDEVTANTAGGGIDTLRTSVDYDLSIDTNGIRSNIDKVTLLTGALAVTGNNLNNIITGAGLTADLTLSGGGGNDAITGGLGNDVLSGGSGIDKLIGGKGDDTYNVEFVLSGTAGKIQDKVTEATNSGTDTLVLHGNVALLKAQTLTLVANVENLDASDTGSTKLNLTGNALNNELTGNDADNILNGGAGNDILDGGLGNDTLLGGAGNDVYVVDSLFDIVSEKGGSGIDTVQSSITYSIAAMADIEHLSLVGTSDIDGTGNGLDNNLTGNSGINALDGSDGNDTVAGGAGDDVLLGGAGDDVLNGGTGFDGVLSDDDTIDGGDGFDIVSYADAVNDIILIMDKSGPQGSGGSGIDLLSNVEGIIGGSGNDHIGGASIVDDQRFWGGAGDDYLDSGLGSDKLDGGAGDDELYGRQGLDTLTGGDGQDTFVYAAADEGGNGETITDFVKGAGGDILDLSELLDSVGYAGSDAFADGYLSLAQVGANTVVRFDADGGGDDYVDLVTLTNVTLTAADSSNFAL